MPPPKNRRTLTDRVIAGLKAQEKRVDYPDSRVPGYLVRVEPDGAKTFYFRYRGKAGQRRYKIGTYGPLSAADAYAQAVQLQARVARGEDPQGEKAEERLAETFGEMADLFIMLHAKPNKRTWQEDERILARDFKDWRSRPAASVTRRDVLAKLDKIRLRGAPAMARNAKALLSKLFTFGIQREIVVTNPAQSIDMGKAPSRDRVLSEDEIRLLWSVWEGEGSVTAVLFQVLLLTAQREIEIMTMRWADLALPWWTVPAGVVKNKLPHRVFLAEPVRKMLESLQPLSGASPWVFASPRRKGEAYSSVNKATERYRALSGVSGWSPHDLRRTAATEMGRGGISRFVIGKVLNHVESGVTAVYDRATYEPETQRAWAWWGGRLLRIVHGVAEPEANVVRIG